jgi:hypothetical protein
MQPTHEQTLRIRRDQWYPPRRRKACQSRDGFSTTFVNNMRLWNRTRTACKLHDEKWLPLRHRGAVRASRVACLHGWTRPDAVHGCRDHVCARRSDVLCAWRARVRQFNQVMFVSSNPPHN